MLALFRACLLTFACCAAQASTVEDADTLVNQFFDASGAPGLAVSVGYEGRLIWSKGYGFADLEQQVAVVPAFTLFRIGSVVKPMTALALMTLVEQGKIDLDADVRRYVPSFPSKSHVITSRQLVSHLGGIRHYLGEEAYLRERYSSVGEALKIFQADPLIATPGAAWNYSSYGFNLLSAAIEHAADKSFVDYMATAVFAPLGMTRTFPDHLEAILPGRGRYYLRRDGALFNEPEVDNSYKWASGGFLSTTDDVVRFGLAHFDDQRVTRSQRELLWTEQRTSAGEPTGYGIGWRVLVDADGVTWVGHGGGSIGGTSQLWLFPQDQLVIAMASNMTELDYADVLPRLRKLFVADVEKRVPTAGD